MFGDPVPYAIFIEEFIARVDRIGCDSQEVGAAKIFSAKGEPAEDGSVQIDRDPHIWIGVVVLQGGKQDKEQAEDEVEGFHEIKHKKNFRHRVEVTKNSI